MRSIILAIATLVPLAAQADEIPACALSGAMSVTIGGRPALRLSDVANCPPELYDIIRSIEIEGQPMVHFKSGAAGKTRCSATGNATVAAEGKQATTLGDVNCRTGQ
jgi:uncharacterized Zn-binding protein involved in type VI secretion